MQVVKQQRRKRIRKALAKTCEQFKVKYLGEIGVKTGFPFLVILGMKIEYG
jgi:hypothetical protein